MIDNKPKVLIFDLETTPALGWFYGKLYDPKIIEVEKDFYILCYAWKWLGEEGVNFERSRGQNDKKIVKTLHKLFSEADIVLAYNGDRFDIPSANTRFINYNLPPPTPYRSVDPLKINRRVFRYPTNRLDYVGKAHGVGGKEKGPGLGMWKRCMNSDRDKEAWSVMETYNKRDVEVLEDEYLQILPWINTHPNVGLYSEDRVCTKCGEGDLVARGYRTTKTGKFQAWQCKNCGGWSQSKKAVSGTILK